MSNVKRFFNAMMMLIVFMVVLVVFAIGYKTFFVNAGHSAMGKGEAESMAGSAEQTAAGMVEQTKDTQNTQAAEQQMNSNTMASTYSAPAMNQAGVIRRNREALDGIIAKLDGTMQYLTIEPNASGAADKADTATKDDSAINDQGSDAAGAVPMTDMGLKYDADKMAKLHSGLYRIAVGRAMLKQLQDELLSQEASAGQNLISPAQYYAGQYDQAVQNRVKLQKAFTYLDGSVDLVSMNPYLSEDGLAYDSERMLSLHQSVLDLADGLASANMLENDFSSQAENYATLSQSMNPISASNDGMTPEVSQPAGYTAAPMDAGLFSGINFDAIANKLPFAFGAFFLLGMIGFLLNQKKPMARMEIPDAEVDKAS
jgi:hypothetical protein